MRTIYWLYEGRVILSILMALFCIKRSYWQKKLCKISVSFCLFSHIQPGQKGLSCPECVLKKFFSQPILKKNGNARKDLSETFLVIFQCGIWLENLFLADHLEENPSPHTLQRSFLQILEERYQNVMYPICRILFFILFFDIRAECFIV